jgi:hypothetical protein
LFGQYSRGIYHSFQEEFSEQKVIFMMLELIQHAPIHLTKLRTSKASREGFDYQRCGVSNEFCLTGGWPPQHGVDEFEAAKASKFNKEQ